MKRWWLFSLLSAGALALAAAPDIGNLFHKLWLASPQLLKPAPDNAYRDLHTWLPNRGLRGLYGHLRGQLNYKTLEKMSGMKIYLKGPHVNGKLDLASAEFGHYNPKFPKWLKQHAIPGHRDPKLRVLYQPVYDHCFRRLARTYFLAHQHLHADPKQLAAIRTTYLQRMADRNSPGRFLGDSFTDYAEQMENNGYDWYEANTAPGFWVRRAVDGTDDEFHAALVTLLRAHDGAFLRQHR